MFSKETNKSLIINKLGCSKENKLSLGTAYAFSSADGKGCHQAREKEKEK
jgi:hypothetical protein